MRSDASGEVHTHHPNIWLEMTFSGPLRVPIYLKHDVPA
jgi:hypothetical protein